MANLLFFLIDAEVPDFPTRFSLVAFYSIDLLTFGIAEKQPLMRLKEDTNFGRVTNPPEPLVDALH